MSQPKSCGCAGKRCGNPCSPVLQAKKTSGCGSRGGGGACGANRARGGGGGGSTGSASCGSPGGCGCLGPFPQKTTGKPSK